MSCSRCSCVYNHTQQTLSYSQRNSKGKRAEKEYCQSSSSTDFFWLPCTVTVNAKARALSPVNDTWQPFFCVEPGDGGHNKRWCQWCRGTSFPFLPSVYSFFLLGVPWGSWLLIWVPFLFSICYPAVALSGFLVFASALKNIQGLLFFFWVNSVGRISVKCQVMVVFVWIQFPCICSCVELYFKMPPY